MFDGSIDVSRRLLFSPRCTWTSRAANEGMHDVVDCAASSKVLERILREVSEDLARHVLILDTANVQP